MKCEKYQEKLSLYIDGELSEREMEEIEKHIASCQDCREEVRSLSNLIKEMKGMQIQPLPRGFKEALHERLQQEQKINQKDRKENVKFLEPFLKYRKQILTTVAASVALLITLPFFYKNIGNKQQEKMESAADYSVNQKMDLHAVEENAGMEIQNLEKAPGTQDLYSTEPSKQMIAEKKIIKRAYIELEVDFLEQRQSEVEKIIKKYEGYSESSNIVSLEGRGVDVPSKEGHMVLKTPVEQYEKVLAEIKAIGKIRTINENREDVTKQYIDVEARVKTLEVQEQRVLEIMQRASKVDELIQLEARLGEIRTQIEAYRTEMKNIDGLAAYSTIEVRFIEISKLKQMQRADQLKNTLDRGILWIAGRIIPMTFLGLLATAFYNVYKKIKKKKGH